MKLLVLIHRLPCPPDRGAKLRAAAELNYLAGRHEVWCAGFVDADNRAARGNAFQSLELWRKKCRAVAGVPLRRSIATVRALGSVLAGSTATEGYFASKRLERVVLGWARVVEFDAVFAFSSSMAPLALRVPAPRRILDMVDLDSRKWSEIAETARWPMRWIYDAEGQRLAGRERDWMSRFDASILVNAREAELLGGNHAEQDPAQRSRVHVIETGVWADGDMIARQRQLRLDESGLTEEPNIGFIGAMDYPPNVEAARWFARSILPLVRAHRRDATLWIIGRSPTRVVRDLDDGESVRVTGAVPSVEPYLAQMRVSVAPLKLARGVQTKVLMAMAAGLPCVVTSCVAAGIGAEPGVQLVVADTPDRFARAVSVLLKDRRRAEALGEAGRRFVNKRFDPGAGMDRLEALLRGYDPGPLAGARSVESDLCTVG